MSLILGHVIPEGCKKCPRCDQVKPFTEFHKSSHRKDGLTCYCKACRTEIRKDFHERYKEKENQRNRDWSRNNRDKINAHYQTYVIKALKLIGEEYYLSGSKENLQLHEIHGKKHPLTHPMKLQYVMEHPEDFVTLSQGCHTALHLLLRKCKDKKKLIRLIQLLNSETTEEI